MIILLPKLAIRIVAVGLSCFRKEVQEPLAAAFLNILFNFLYHAVRRIFLQVAHDFGECSRTVTADDEMHRVTHDDVPVKYQALLVDAVPQTIQQQVFINLAGKHVYPAYYRKSNEIQSIRIGKLIPGAHLPQETFCKSIGPDL